MKYRIRAAAFAATALIGVACSSDDKAATPAAGATTTIAGADPAATTPAGGIDTVPAIPGVAPECLTIINAIAASAQAASGQGDLAEAQAAMQGLAAGVPDELKADAQIFATAFGEYLTVLAQYEGDITKAMQAPEAVAVLQAISTPEVSAAGDRLSAYMDANCEN